MSNFEEIVKEKQFKKNFYDYTLSEDLIDERKHRLEKIKTLPYGVKFLDDSLGGFTSSELVLVGSKTGFGKSQFCSILAEANAKAGNKGLFIALEAEAKEVGRRIKFRYLCQYYNVEHNNKFALSYGKWRQGKLENELGKYEDAVNKDLVKFSDNLIIQYRTNDIDSDKLAGLITQHKDLSYIILDHLHYVDMVEPNENMGLKKIIKAIRKANLEFGIPLIVVTHLRKTNKKFDTLTPALEDIHGTSDIAKESTTAILFSPSSDLDHEHLANTYFHIPKSRFSDARIYTARLRFNKILSRYEDEYELGKHNDSMKFEFPKYYPEWFPYERQQEEAEGDVSEYAKRKKGFDAI